MPQSGLLFITNIIFQLLIKHRKKSYVFLFGNILFNNENLLKKFSKGIIIIT
jgi:hypothetical protein